MTNIPPLVHVTKVIPLQGFVLRLWFDDGSQRDVDVEWLLRGPIFDALRNNPKLFREVEVDGGSIVWPNGADIDPVVLHGSAVPAWKDDEAPSKAG
jgi:hypothetical protein